MKLPHHLGRDGENSHAYFSHQQLVSWCHFSGLYPQQLKSPSPNWSFLVSSSVFWGQVYAKENRIDKTLPNPRRRQTFHEVGSSLIALCVLNRTPQLRIGDEETEHLKAPHCWSMPWFSSATAPSFRRFIVGGSSPEEHPCAKWSNGAQEEMLCCGHLLLKPQRKLYQFYCTTWRNTKRALLLCDKLHICLIRHRKLAHIRNVQMNVQNSLAS